MFWKRRAAFSVGRSGPSRESQTGPYLIPRGLDPCGTVAAGQAAPGRALCRSQNVELLSLGRGQSNCKVHIILRVAGLEFSIQKQLLGGGVDAHLRGKACLLFPTGAEGLHLSPAERTCQRSYHEEPQSLSVSLPH